MLVTPETNTAVSGRDGSRSGPNRGIIVESWIGNVLNAPLVVARATDRKRRI
jgi:hypothetical protein